MHDEPVMPNMPQEYGSLPEELEDKVKPLCKGRTIAELRMLGDYFNKKASDMSREAEAKLTMEDYEKVLKKGDNDDY